MGMEGKLTRWNDDRGFGFIAPKGGGAEVFVHISAFPRDGMRPVVGEQVSFEIAVRDGKTCARNVKVAGRPTVAARRDPPPRKRTVPAGSGQGRKGGGWLMSVLAVAGLVAFAYHSFARQAGPETTDAQPSPVSVAREDKMRFRCDGRTHCSQMTSCAEATYFLQNCPGVEMDGNGDGVPCERQWCSSGFAQ